MNWFLNRNKIYLVEYQMANEKETIVKICNNQNKKILTKDLEIMESTVFYLRKYRTHFGICSNVFEETGKLIDDIERNIAVIKKYFRFYND